MGGQFSSRGSERRQRLGEQSSTDGSGAFGGVNEVLFFPDEKMPCRYGKQCRRGARCEYAHDRTTLTRFLSHINSAKRSMDVCVFTITCNEIADALLAAHQRGVRVRIISDDDQSKTKGSDVERLAQAGIAVRLDNSPMHMHHKFAVIDERLLLNGSFNWTRQAVLGNRENVLVTTAPQLYRDFIKEFKNLWQLYQNNKL